MSSSPESPSAAAGTVTRCPSCGARVRPEDEWCTLCLTRVDHGPPADLSPEPEPEPEPAPVAEAAAPPEGVETVELAGGDTAAEVTGDVEDAGDDEVTGDDEDDELRAERDAEADRMIAALAATETSGLPPQLAVLRPRGRAAGAVLATFGGMVVLGIIMATMAVVGRFL